MGREMEEGKKKRIGKRLTGGGRQGKGNGGRKKSGRGIVDRQDVRLNRGRKRRRGK